MAALPIILFQLYRNSYEVAASMPVVASNKVYCAEESDRSLKSF